MTFPIDDLLLIDDLLSIAKTATQSRAPSPKSTKLFMIHSDKYERSRMSSAVRLHQMSEHKSHLIWLITSDASVLASFPTHEFTTAPFWSIRISVGVPRTPSELNDTCLTSSTEKPKLSRYFLPSSTGCGSPAIR